MKSYNTTIGDLMNVEFPIETDTYKPIRHIDVIDSIKEQIDKKNIIISKEIYKSANSGLQLLGELRLASKIDNEIDMSMLFQNSYNKTLSLKLASGFFVFICGNGCVCGSSGKFKKKHVGEIQTLTPLKIIEQLNNVEKDFQKAIDFKKRAKEIEITKKTCAQLLGRLYFEEELISSTQMGIIKGEMELPQFNYGVNNTLWNLYSDITHSQKSIHPSLFLHQASEISKFFENEYQLV